MGFITSITQMVCIPVTDQMRILSEERCKEHSVDREPIKGDSIEDENKRHAYVATGFEFWCREHGIKNCNYLKKINYDFDVSVNDFGIEVKTKKINHQKIFNGYSQRIGNDWSILIPKRNYDQKPDHWLFGGCYDNYNGVELFGWLPDEVYRHVRVEYSAGTWKGTIFLDHAKYDVKFQDMYPMS
jgi:hypothetical protein